MGKELPNLHALRADYDRDGYVIVDGLFDDAIEPLRSETEGIVRDTRNGQWPFVRRVGKQFPPFDAVTSPDYWGVQHLMHPEMPHTDSFRDFYSQQSFLQISAALMGCEASSLQMELFNLLIEPKHHAFALGWHRDDIRPNVTPQEEDQTLATPVGGVQWNAVLFDDDCLFVVPGSHRRRRTSDEIAANRKDPPEPINVDDLSAEKAAAIDGSWEVDPKETLRVQLKAGQTVFYSQRILHRASYLPTRRRATLHGCYGQAGGGGERARMILQHDVDWMKEASFGDSLPANGRLKSMWQLLMSEYAHRNKSDYGYSLSG
ncbi:unnamed protein product [Jaminaea pallidilutea]